MYLQINFEPEKSKELEEYVKAKLPELIENILLTDNQALDRLLDQCVKGQVKQHINEILQSPDYKKILRDSVIQKLGLEQ